MIRACIDTNILISGLISPKGAPHEILLAYRRREFALITSKEILNELEGVLNYSRIKTKYKLSQSQIENYLLLLRKFSYEIDVTSDFDGTSADPDDDKFLSAAVNGNVGYIVSGDHHLLDLGTFQGIRILTAKQFIEAINQGLGK